MKEREKSTPYWIAMRCAVWRSDATLISSLAASFSAAAGDAVKIARAATDAVNLFINLFLIRCAEIPERTLEARLSELKHFDPCARSQFALLPDNFATVFRVGQING